MKRILLFVLTNVAVMAVLLVTTRILGVDRFLTANGLNMTALAGFSLVIGFGGAIISLLMSKPMAKFSTGARVINQPQNADEAWIVQTVQKFADKAGIGMPEVAIFEGAPNAFATGRNPENAAVAATAGLLRMLDRREVRGVMAHELAHVKNRDTLTMTITATVAGAISALANFALFFGGNDKERPGGMIGTIALMILAPMAAGLVQMAISRAREYEADRGGAEICGDPEALADALQKIEHYARGTVNLPAERNPATGQMFIINPLSGRGADNLFSTHPATQNRVRALMDMAGKVAAPVQRAARAVGTAVPITRRPKDGPWG